MCLLTENQVALIFNDVENEGINFSHLGADLVDHICCDIENHMHRGISFDQAYHEVRIEFGIKGLRQIQQDTLMLIDKNYRIMKKSMKWIGVLAMALMAFGAMFKIYHLPGAAIMLLVSFFFTTFVFFPTLLYVVYKEANQKKQLGLFVVAFISGALFMTGVLFKILHWPEGNLILFSGTGILAYLLIPAIIILNIKKISYNKAVFLSGLISIVIFLSGLAFKMQHWPGANIMLSLGSLLMVFLFVPLFYRHEVCKADKLRIDFIFGIIGITYIIVLGFLLNLSTNKSELVDFRIQEKSFSKTSDALKTNNDALIANTSDRMILELTQQANKVCNLIEDLKLSVIETYKRVNEKEAKALKNSDNFNSPHC